MEFRFRSAQVIACKPLSTKLKNYIAAFDLAAVVIDTDGPHRRGVSRDPQNVEEAYRVPAGEAGHLLTRARQLRNDMIRASLDMRSHDHA